MIYHIYWGTAGNSGLYLDEIYQVLNNSRYKQKVFVSYYYPFNYGEKIFFKYTNMENTKFKGFLRRILQLIEIFFAFSYILISSIKDKPLIVNYSLIGSTHIFILWFLKLIKKITKCNLIITCHDVLPFANSVISNKKEMKNRTGVFNYADYLLVHNKNSIRDLKEHFKINEIKILIHSFPLMDLSKLYDINSNIDKKYDFLFIGHLRKEKGVEFLLNSWSDFHKECPNAKLCISGNASPIIDKINVIKDRLESENVEFHLNFISDIDYFTFVNSSRFVILPYVSGTNSGIISTVLSIGANVITSDIPMFRNNSFLSDDDMFISNNKDSLIDILKRKIKENNKSYSFMIDTYRKQFSEEVIEAYNFNK